jgi:hypothetical protein
MKLYGGTLARHHDTGDPGTATTDLTDNGKFGITAAPDPAGPTQVLIRQPGTPVFLIIGYTLG